METLANGVVRAVRFELDPRKALIFKDVILRQDGTCESVAYTVPGWRVPRNGQSAEDARTVVTLWPGFTGLHGFHALVKMTREFEAANDLIRAEWKWVGEPTEGQRADTVTYPENSQSATV